MNLRKTIREVMSKDEEIPGFGKDYSKEEQFEALRELEKTIGRRSPGGSGSGLWASIKFSNSSYNKLPRNVKDAWDNFEEAFMNLNSITNETEGDIGEELGIKGYERR